MVVHRYNQKEGIYYDETFSAVARTRAIRILIAFFAYIEFKLFLVDVKSAFLNGYLKKELYMKQPPLFEKIDHASRFILLC